MSADGCISRECPDDETVDVATGACVGKTSLARTDSLACASGAVPVAEGGELACLPAAATCPRGTDRLGSVCARRPTCPAGTLASRHATCVPLVTAGGRATGPADSADAIDRRVDVGEWAALALGVDGGKGSPDLCRPMEQRPAAFGVGSDAVMSVRVRVRLAIPDQDLSRVDVRVEVHAEPGRQAGQGGQGGHLAPAADRVVWDSVSTLVETLRSWGGEASAGDVETEVRCTLGSPKDAN